MSRKVKFSSSWKKAKARLQRIHARIGNARRNFLHKATTAISQNHALVVIEDLQVRHMSRSAAGTSEQPGKNVRPKSGLNKSILDQGWFEFRRQLDYKLTWSGGWLIAVPPPDLSGLRLCERGQPDDTGEVHLRRLRLRGQGRCRRRNQHSGAGTPRCSLWRDGAVRPF